jgi:hypothetical protein
MGLSTWWRGLPPWRGRDDTSRGRRTPLGAAPCSPIKGGHSSPSLTHLSLLLLLLLHHCHCLAKLCRKIVRSLQRSGVGVSDESFLSLPHWTKGVEDVNKPYVWTSTEVLPIVAPWVPDLEIVACTPSSSSTTFVRERIPAYGLREWVTRWYHLVDMILAR